MENKPGAIGGPHADIIVSVVWRSLTRVNAVDQTFDAEVEIKATAPNGINRLDESFKGPQLILTNAVSATRINEPVFEEKANGDLVEETHIRGTFTSHFELQNFPLDVQELSIFVQCDRAVLVPGPNVNSKQKVRLIVSDVEDPVPCTIIEPGFTIAPILTKLQSMQIQAGHSPASDSSRGSIYSRIHTSIVIERQPGFFFWNAIFPTFIFTTMAFLSMAVPPELVADRLAVTVALMLTNGAYKIISANAIPEVPFLTLLDIYVVGSLIISAFVAIQNASGLLGGEDGEPDRDIDRLFGQVLIGLWALFNLVYFFRWEFVRRFRRNPPIHNDGPLKSEGVPFLSPDPELKSISQWYRKIDKKSSKVNKKSFYFSEFFSERDSHKTI